MIQVICDICGEASQKPFGFRPENGLAFFGTENPERYPYHLCEECAELIGLISTTILHDADNITQTEEKSNEDEETVEL